MGRPIRDAAGYRDDPDAVSLHTTPDDYNYDDAPEISGPPAYTDNEAAVIPSSTSVASQTHQESHMNHDEEVHLSHGKPEVNDVQNLMDSRFDTDPVYLEDGVKDFANTAPVPLVYIMGTHSETIKKGDKKETKNVTDFRIVLNMQKYLRRGFHPNGTRYMDIETVENGEKTLRGGFMKKRAPGAKQDLELGTAKPELREWCHRYCASPSRLRIFRLTRTIAGFDEMYVRERIEGLIRSSDYRGHLSVTFPVENRYIDFYTANRINRWRTTKWICWVFYLTFLWIFTWPYLFFATKRYSVVRAQWNFSHPNPGTGRKEYATISEEEWVGKWGVGIRRLALETFQGEPSEATLEAVMARPQDPQMPGSIRFGHEGVDNTVGILTQGFRVASAISRGGDLGHALQDGWGYDR